MAMTNVYTGATGTLQILATDQSKPEGADAAVLLDGTKMYDLSTVGRVTGVEIHVNTNLQGYYEVGRRHPVSLHPENVHISGKINRAYINGALLFLLLGRGANPTFIDERPASGPGPYPIPSMVMNLILQDPAVPNTQAKLTLSGVKFENWAFSLPEDDFVMENVTFKALTISIHDEDNPSGSATSANEKKPNFPALATH